MRIVADCPNVRGGDTSAVFHRGMIDDPPTTVTGPWFFDTNEGLQVFATENEAFDAQRAYRIAHGFDPITGNPNTGA